MIIKQEISLRDFEAWSGGRDTFKDLEALDEVVDYDVFEALENAFDAVEFYEVTDTELNDMLWFEREYIANLLGFDSYADLEKMAYGEED